MSEINEVVNHDGNAKDLVDEILGGIKGTGIASIDFRTNVRMRGGKKNPLIGRTEKVVTGASVLLFTSFVGYMNRVNRELAKEGKPAVFEPGERVWGERVGDTPYIRHVLAGTGVVRYYLQCVFQSPGTIHYEVDGRKATADELEYIQEMQQVYQEADQGGLDKKEIVRIVALGNITGIRVGGKAFVFNVA